MTVAIRSITRGDAPRWEELRCALWPGHDAEHRQEIAAFFAGTLPEPGAVLLAEEEGGRIVAIAELSVRSDLPELDGRRVGYVEGLYVIPEVRNRGIARRLLQASREWARQQACTVFASDRAERIVVDRSFRVSECGC
jgi:aminoglycoside 6'-N-acetyltransferase I